MAAVLASVISIAHGLRMPAHVLRRRDSVRFGRIVGGRFGRALVWRAERLGAWLVATTMAGSLGFGFVNHFVFSSPDHVAHVAPPWRPLFATTAILLTLTEALGAGLAIRLARERESVS